jgi:hypothetical protein
MPRFFSCPEELLAPEVIHDLALVFGQNSPLLLHEEGDSFHVFPLPYGIFDTLPIVADKTFLIDNLEPLLTELNAPHILLGNSLHSRYHHYGKNQAR